MKLALVDIGCANTSSVALAFERLGITPLITNDGDTIASADRVVLPGVGAAGYAMARIEALGLQPVLCSLTQPVLGICLGMQLLFERSEEGDTLCLGVIAGTVRKLTSRPGAPVPHMGWGKLTVQESDLGIETGDYVYFAHSFVCENGQASVAATDYDGEAIPAIVRQANYWGVQFHPERSSAAGARFLQAFVSS